MLSRLTHYSTTSNTEAKISNVIHSDTFQVVDQAQTQGELPERTPRRKTTSANDANAAFSVVTFRRSGAAEGNRCRDMMEPKMQHDLLMSILACRGHLT